MIRSVSGNRIDYSVVGNEGIVEQLIGHNICGSAHSCQSRDHYYGTHFSKCSSAVIISRHMGVEVFDRGLKLQLFVNTSTCLPPEQKWWSIAN